MKKISPNILTFNQIHLSLHKDTLYRGKKEAIMNNKEDHVDMILKQWAKAEPDKDASPMGTFTRIFRLYKYVSLEIAALFRKKGLHDGEFDLLATLYRCGKPEGLTPNELRSHAVLSSGAMTNRLDRLEGAGLIERVANPDDRRSVLIKITPDGLNLLQETLDGYLELLHKIESPLSSNQKENIKDALRTLLYYYENENKNE